METYLLLMMVGVGAYAINTRDQRRRIGLLASHLRNFRIEKLMETLDQAYQRALGEDSPQRRDQIWELMNTDEAALSSQFCRLAAQIGKLDADLVRVSTLPIAIPFADRLFPRAAFDLRRAFDIHAQGISNAVSNIAGKPPKERAFILSAEMFLMQHTCHWYCKSRTVASARLLARHKSSHAQVLAAVSPETRRAYVDLIGQRA